MPDKGCLKFKRVETADYDRIYSYTSKHGEGSCQYSPVSMYSLSKKYGDSICEKDGFLYTLRSRLCDKQYRVYMAPLGDGRLPEAYRQIFDDAAACGKRVRLFTLTETQAALVRRSFPGRFEFMEERDLAEYIYKTEKMATFSGGELRKRRGEVHTFWNTYGGRASVSRITEQDFDECLDFEIKWMKENLPTHDPEFITRDAKTIADQLVHYNELHLSGAILRVDGKVCGICYGTCLGDTYDVLVEKADRTVPHSYKVLRQESTRLCAGGMEWVNYEEDLGIPGLRKLKNAYKPDHLLRKYIVTERGLA